MPKRKLTAYYHPTTVVFVDKERDFLLNICSHLSDEVAFRLCDNSSLALTMVEKSIIDYSKKNYFHFEELGEFPFVHHTISLSVNDIHKEIYNPHRFEHISVLVIDLATPELDGLDVCIKLKGTGIKIILLTEKSEEKVAISAFNQGLIHGYISKRDKLALKGLGKQIELLQRTYFKENIESLLDALPFRSYPFIQDQVFQMHFSEIIHNFGIVEYYLIEKPTGFLLIDKNGQSFTLGVLDYMHLTLQKELAKDWGASEEVVKAIENEDACLMIPSHVQKPKAKSFEEWLVPIEAIVGEEQVYYLAWLEGSSLASSKSIKTFADFMQDFDFATPVQTLNN